MNYNNSDNSNNSNNSNYSNRTVTIFDTTLRDGEQTPGVSLTTDDKIEIAYQLDKLGVDYIEAGFPHSSPGDFDAVKKISEMNLNASVCGLARAVKKDVDACIECDVDLIHTFVPTSEIQRKATVKKSIDELSEIVIDVLEYINDHGIKCMFSPMDATRTDMNDLLKIVNVAESAGADIINIPDTVGIIKPSSFYEFIKTIKENQKSNIPLAVHCHNDFGLAAANSLMAFEAGADQIQVTVNGIGERAGNASLPDVVMSLKSLYGANTNIKTEYLTETSKLVEKKTGIRIMSTTPIVGKNAFSHESGIHAQGVLIDSETFEPGLMTPEMVGQKRHIVLGKHTGRFSVKSVLENSNLEPTDSQINEIMEKIKEIGDKGRKVTDADLFAIASVVMEKREISKVIDLKEVSVMTGNVLTPTAVIKAEVNGKEKIAAKPGVGPVDAALKAVEEIAGASKFKIKEFNIEAISGGSDALANVTIVVQDENGRNITAMSANADIVLASVEALVYAMNVLAGIEKT